MNVFEENWLISRPTKWQAAFRTCITLRNRASWNQLRHLDKFGHSSHFTFINPNKELMFVSLCAAAPPATERSDDQRKKKQQNRQVGVKLNQKKRNGEKPSGCSLSRRANSALGCTRHNAQHNTQHSRDSASSYFDWRCFQCNYFITWCVCQVTVC